jgi:hypothetical protein
MQVFIIRTYKLEVVAHTFLAIPEVKIRRIIDQGQPRQEVFKTLSQPIKAGYGDVCLSFQLCRKHKKEDHSSGQPGYKCKMVSQKTEL